MEQAREVLSKRKLGKNIHGGKEPGLGAVFKMKREAFSEGALRGGSRRSTGVLYQWAAFPLHLPLCLHLKYGYMT